MRSAVRTWLLVALIAGALALGAAACGDDRGGAPGTEPTSSPTAEPTVVRATETPPPTEAGASPEAVACAAGSTDRFLEAQGQVSWPVFCPTFLPAGFELEELTVDVAEYAPGVTPPAAELPASVEATFTNSEGASVTLSQGDLGASLLSSLVGLAEDEGITPESLSFGGLEGTLYGPLTTISGADLAAFVVAYPASPPPEYLVETEEVALDVVRQIAAGMRPVSP